jgi:hypothetical protein
MVAVQTSEEEKKLDVGPDLIDLTKYVTFVGTTRQPRET